jgi:integrase
MRGSRTRRKHSIRATQIRSTWRRIYLIRGQKVILDSDLAELYDVPTFRLNEAVKRNQKRFPADFILFDYLDAAGLRDAAKDASLFPTAIRKTGQLATRAIHVNDVCRMMKRRLRDAGLPENLSPHSFRVTTITDLLEQGVPLEDVQRLAGHADPRTTRLYDRRDKKITQNVVARISV